MKRKIALSIAIVLSVVMLSLMSPNSTAMAQQESKFVTDSGIVTLGANQMLRITVGNGLDALTVRFRRFEYIQGICDGGVCKHLISSQNVSNPITLAPGEGARFDISGHEGADIAARGVVTSNRKGAKVLFQIINSLTGEIVSTFIGGGDDGQSI